MRQILAAEIKDLEAQETQISNEIESVRQTEPYDPHRFSNLKAELETVQATLTTARAKLANFEGVETSAQNEITQSLESLNIPGTDKFVPLSYLIMTETVALEDKIAIIASAFEQKLIGSAIVQSSLELENTSLKRQANQDETENLELRGELSQFKLKTADLESKLNNAGTQIEELKEEGKRKDEQIDTLRDQLSKSSAPYGGSVSDVKVDNIDEGLESRPAIYNIRWESELKHVFKLATLAETGKEIRFHYFNQGLYRVLEEDEVNRFLEEMEAKRAIEAAKLAEEAAVQDIPLVVPPTFQFPTPTIDGLAMESSEEVGAVVTRQEYEARFKRIEEHLGLVTWRMDEDEAKEVA